MRASRGDTVSPRSSAFRKSYRWLLWVPMALLLGALADLADTSAEDLPPEGAMPELAVAGRDSSPSDWTAVVFLQASDCSGNLSIVRPLLVQHAKQHITKIELVDVSRGTDLSYLKAQLPAELKRLPVRKIRGEERQVIRNLGFSETPLVLLRDRNLRVRMAIPTLSEPSERIATNRAVSHIVLGDPSR